MKSARSSGQWAYWLGSQSIRTTNKCLVTFYDKNDFELRDKSDYWINQFTCYSKPLGVRSKLAMTRLAQLIHAESCNVDWWKERGLLILPRDLTRLTCIDALDNLSKFWLLWFIYDFNSIFPAIFQLRLSHHCRLICKGKFRKQPSLKANHSRNLGDETSSLPSFTDLSLQFPLLYGGNLLLNAASLHLSSPSNDMISNFSFEYLVGIRSKSY